jgi:anti-sigma factor RsiW
MEKKLSRLTTEQRYALVGYLDGELTDPETVQIEKLLAESAVARTDVELLAATYELLNELPRPKAPSGFAEKTMATARLEEVRPDLTQSPWYQRLRWAFGYAGWIAVLLAAGLVGYAATRFWTPQEHDILVRDFEIIHQLDKYAEVETAGFLERLSNDHELLREIRGDHAPAR